MKMIKPHLKAIIWVGLYFVLQIFSMIAVFAFELFFNKDFLVRVNYGLLAEDTSKLMEEFSQIILPSLALEGVLIILIFSAYLYLTHKKDVHLKKISVNSGFKYALMAIVANLVISLVLTFLPESIYMSQLNDSTNTALTGSIFIVVLGTGILIPILEEIVFRYGIGYHLAKINVKYALIMQAVVFGLMHGNLIQCIYAGLLGLLFGYIDYKEQSLIPSIIMHITLNMSSVLATYMPINEFITMMAIIVILLFGYGFPKIIKLKEKRFK